MNKKTFGVAAISLFSLITITGCNDEAKPNGKDKSDYNLTNNVELSAYYGHEIVHDNVSFNIVKDDETENYNFVISSNNSDIKTYDIVEIYETRVDNKQNLNNHINLINSPVTFEVGSPKKTAYLNLGKIYVRKWNCFSDDCQELRIIGESVNITYHLWEDYGDASNGKTVDDYDYTNNEIENAYYTDAIICKLGSDQELMGVGMERFVGTDFSRYLSFQFEYEFNKDVDVIQICATDSNKENKRVLLDKPFTIDHNTGWSRLDLRKENYANIYIGVKDLPDDYYNLCNQNVSFYVVTNYHTFIFQTYSYVVNGKTKSDYVLKNLTESYGETSVEPEGGSFASFYAYENSTYVKYFGVHSYCNIRTNEIDVSFHKFSDCRELDSFDVVEAYFSDGVGNNVEYIITTPITMLKFSSKQVFYLNIPMVQNFKEYCALCKDNVKLHIVTNLGIIHIAVAY